LRLTKVEKNHSLKILNEKKTKNPVRFSPDFKKISFEMDSGQKTT
jgi:hypothetical protein